jgi:anti-sigma-K factor RskA
MKHERVTEELRELAALYTLGSLTQLQARSFEIHIHEECPACRAEYLRFQRIAAGIGFAAEEVAPPEYLRDLLTARVERGEQIPVPAEMPGNNIEDKPQPKKPPVQPFARSAIFQPPQQKPGFFPWILAAALAVLALMAFYAWRSEQRANGRLQAKVASAQSDAENLRILMGVRNARSTDLEQIQAMCGKPGVRIARLAGQAPAPSAAGAILWDPQESRYLVFGHFPPTDEGMAYQLWLLTQTTKIPAGLLKVDPTGRTFTSAGIPHQASGITGAGVTVEPAQGSPTPTTRFHALGRFE